MGRPRISKTAVVRLLDQVTFPIYLIDTRRRIVYCNPACAVWLRCDVAELIGRRCDYHSLPDAADSDPQVAGLSPPPAVLAGQSAHDVVAALAAGESSRRRAAFVPLTLDADTAGAVLVFVSAEELPGGGQPLPPEEPPAVHDQIRQLRQRLGLRYQLDRLLGGSSALERVRAQVRLAVDGSPRVVVVGPPGSGREHVARAIHYNRAGEAMHDLVPLSCPLLDAELLQSTVEAFLRRCAELATPDTGSLLLLEIDQLPVDAQAALVGFLNIPELALQALATARTSLVALAAEGRFRADLADAMSTLVIRLPPLAERIEDIPVLAQAAVEQVNAKGQRQLGGLTPAAIDQLVGYPWPGNVDELSEMVQQAHAAADGQLIDAHDLPATIHLAAAAAELPARELETIQLDQFLLQIERELVSRALTAAKGNKASAARLLGIHRSRLLRKIEQLDLDG